MAQVFGRLLRQLDVDETWEETDQSQLSHINIKVHGSCHLSPTTSSPVLSKRKAPLHDRPLKFLLTFLNQSKPHRVCSALTSNRQKRRRPSTVRTACQNHVPANIAMVGRELQAIPQTSSRFPFSDISLTLPMPLWCCGRKHERGSNDSNRTGGSLELDRTKL